jgi:hypothetical protein
MWIDRGNQPVAGVVDRFQVAGGNETRDAGHREIF